MARELKWALPRLETENESHCGPVHNNGVMMVMVNARNCLPVFFVNKEAYFLTGITVF